MIILLFYNLLFIFLGSIPSINTIILTPPFFDYKKKIGVCGIKKKLQREYGGCERIKNLITKIFFNKKFIAFFD